MLFPLPIFAFVYIASNQRVDVTVIAPKKKKTFKPAVLFTKIMYIKICAAHSKYTGYTIHYCILQCMHQLKEN